MVYKICSFSGGGIRGIIPATIVQEMLITSKKHGGTGKITDLCDHVVGTSAGGIISAGLTVSEDGQNPKYNPAEITDILMKNSEVIFHKPECTNSTLVNSVLNSNSGFLKKVNSYQYGLLTFGIFSGVLLAGVPATVAYLLGTKMAVFSIVAIGSAIGGAIGIQGDAIINHPESICGVRELTSPKYDRRGLDSVLQKYFGHYNLTDTIIPFTTFSFSLNDGTIKSFSTIKAQKSPLDNFYLRDAVGATSAAPTFFAHKVITTFHNGETKEHHEVDSGLYNNSPISLVLAMLKKHASDEVLEKIETEGISFLSIGTGLHMHRDIHKSIKNEGMLGWAPLATRTAMEGVEYASIIEGKYMHNSSRIDVEMQDDIPMDSSDPSTINMLQRLARDRAANSDVMDYVECVVKAEQESCKIQGNLPFESEFFNDLI